MINPSYSSSTRDYGVSDQFHVFQSKMAAFGLKAVAVGRPEQEGFDAETNGYSVGSILIFEMMTEGFEGVRDDQTRKSNNIDHWALSLWRSGAGNFDIDGRSVQVKKGQMNIESVANPNPGKVDRNDTVYVMLQRDSFKGLESTLDDLCRFDGVGSIHPLLGEYLESVIRNLKYADPSEYENISDATENMVKACTIRSPDAIEQASAPIEAAQLAVAKKFIAKYLTAPELNPHFISNRLGISIRKIYSIFESEGGVDRYIKTLRLNASYRNILLGGEDEKIFAVAEQLGFQDIASFGRQFRNQFGVSPRQVRQQTAHAPALVLENWLAGSAKPGRASGGPAGTVF